MSLSTPCPLLAHSMSTHSPTPPRECVPHFNRSGRHTALRAAVCGARMPSPSTWREVGSVEPRTDAVTLAFSCARKLSVKWLIYAQFALDNIVIIDVFSIRAARADHRKANSRRHFAAISRAFAATLQQGLAQ